jgi:hypothetical protein
VILLGLSFADDRYTYPTANPLIFLFTGGSSDGNYVVAKRGKTERPPGCRSSTCVPSKPGQTSAQPSSAGGRVKPTGKRKKGKDTTQDDDLVEQEPVHSTATLHIAAWRRLRESNTYRFKERTYTGGDRELWTKTQACVWDDFYSSPDHMRNGTFV